MSAHCYWVSECWRRSSRSRPALRTGRRIFLRARRPSRQQPRRKDRPVCGAKTRAGRACRMRVEFGKARCRLHGGLSTGPKTEASRARIAEAQRRRWRDYRERRHGVSLAVTPVVKEQGSD
jgi:hypothetical protein